MAEKLYIQTTRFENKFDVVYYIDEELLKYKTFKLLIQPFIENAIKHGLKDITSGGKIIIRVMDESGTINIEIIDNCCGMPQAKIDDILARNGQGIGIYNVNQFIKLNYGEEYSITIFSQPGEGTRVVIRIPGVEGEDEGDV